MKAPGASSRNPAIYVALIPTAVLLAVWPLGLAAFIREQFGPAIPQWLVISAAAAAVLGVLALVGSGLRTRLGQRLARVLVGCLFVPLFVALFGWGYFWLSGLIGRNREPGTTLALAVGLGVTVFGFGIATSMEFFHLAVVFAGSLLGLAGLRLKAWPSTVSMTHFGFLHCLTLFGVMVVASVEDAQRRRTISEAIDTSRASEPTR